MKKIAKPYTNFYISSRNVILKLNNLESKCEIKYIKLG